jgi:hypothetical protein
VDKIMRALAKAPSASSLFVPTAQVVREIALALPREQSPLPYEIVPMRALPEATRELKADNPFLLLAQKWEEKSQELRLNPERVTPAEIGKQRFQEVESQLDHCCHDMGGA